MKVLVNNCYGGFGLSSFAMKKILSLRYGEIYVYQVADYENKLYQKVSTSDIDSNLINADLVLFSTKDYGNSTIGIDLDNLSREEGTNLSYNFYAEDYRLDKDLIELYEKYGSEAVSGCCSELTLVEIPKGCLFKITSHDGLEMVEQQYPSEEWFYAFE